MVSPRRSLGVHGPRRPFAKAARGSRVAKARPMRIAVVHGPNLDLLGDREPALYGHVRLADIDRRLAAIGRELGALVSTYQSNHEGAIIDHLHALRGRCDGLLVNAAALTHTSVGVRDALAALGTPFIEVHLSNVFAREPFRHHSYLSDIARGLVCGFGADSYELALRGLAAALRAQR